MVFREGSTADGAQILTGDEVQSASPTYDQSGNYAVALSFTCDHPSGGGGRRHQHLAG